MVLKSSFQKILTRMRNTLSESLGIYLSWPDYYWSPVSDVDVCLNYDFLRINFSNNHQVSASHIHTLFASFHGKLDSLLPIVVIWLRWVLLGHAFIDHVDLLFGGSSIKKTSLRRLNLKFEKGAKLRPFDRASQSVRQAAVASDTLSGRLFGVSDLLQRPMVSISMQQYIATGRSAGSITILPQQDVMSRLRFQTTQGRLVAFLYLLLKILFIGKRLLLFYFFLKLHHSSPKALTDRHE
ncbi:hypothetical protein T07_9392 [Trichinella nelsoni]|uniref:Uncharacterized protein n=1 Tax=Trichinella nelsoni TaxID=6336 RepID=A0A0V0RUJ5_9BILA|nr:hypothetical protein T07_9392 [Trichinella nelsoni]